MDPKTALEAILCGSYDDQVEHLEALRGWLDNGGFEPEIPIPAAQSRAMNWVAFFVTHCERSHGSRSFARVWIKANKVGLWTSETRDNWAFATDWQRLLSWMEPDELPRMMPGVEPYTVDEWAAVQAKLAAAAEASETIDEDELEEYALKVRAEEDRKRGR